MTVDSVRVVVTSSVIVSLSAVLLIVVSNIEAVPLVEVNQAVINRESEVPEL